MNDATETALKVLVSIAKDEQEAADYRIRAACAILNRDIRSEGESASNSHDHTEARLP